MIHTQQANRPLVGNECPDLESSSESYARRFAGPVGNYFLRVQLDVVSDMLPGANCKVLDVGGGHCQLAPTIADRGDELTVFGSDDSCTDRLDRVVGSNRYSLVTGNLLELPFADDFFDVVLAFRLLPHLQAWRSFITELCRVAKQCVILDYPTLKSANVFSRLMFSWKQRVEKNARRYKCFGDQQIQAAFHDCDFRIEKKQGQFFLPMALHRLVGNANFSTSTEHLAKAFGATALFGSPVVVKTVPVCH